VHLPLDDPTSLSLLYHLNSEPWLNDEAYAGAGRQEELRRIDRAGPEVALPATDTSPVTELLRRRRSCRAFARRPMPLGSLGALAASAQGVLEVEDLDGGGTLVRRSAPSAGGLYPLELYVFCQRVEGVSDGLHRYHGLGHSLEELRRDAPVESLAEGLYAYPFVRDANAIFAVAARFRRTQAKYGPRGYRYVLLEAGHAVQSLCLRAAELGLSTLCIGGFIDSAVNELLGLHSTTGGVVYMVAAGHQQDQPT
jgi:SagB-type dehydrogenase family enzyme